MACSPILATFCDTYSKVASNVKFQDTEDERKGKKEKSHFNQNNKPKYTSS